MFNSVHRALRESQVKVTDVCDKGRQDLLSRLDVYIGSQIANLSAPVVEKSGKKRLVEKGSGNLDSNQLAWQIGYL